MSAEPPPPSTAPSPPPPPAPSPSPPPPPQTETTTPADLILFRRRTIYVQGVLFVLVAAISFALGYLAGRNSRNVAPAGLERRLPDARPN